jgi:membrane-associated phospholipid phosphatase
MPAVYRLEAASAAVRELFPPALTPVYEAVTALGGIEVLVAGLTLLYWLDGERRRGTATVIAYGLVAVAVVLALKAWFALPRPPASVRLVGIDGYGFPSGHAAAATVVFGGLAVERGWPADRRRIAGVAVVVAAVALSRVVLGVHYLGDVVAGVGVGLAVLAVTRTVAAGDPARSFAVGTVAAIGVVAVVGVEPRTVSVLGAAASATLVSRRWRADELPHHQSPAEVATLLVGGTGVVGLLARVGAPLIRPVPVAAGLGALIVAAILRFPAVLSTIRRREERLPAADSDRDGTDRRTD